MTALLLSPHNDDATLFAAFTCLREKPDVVTLLHDGNGQADEREAEDRAAMEILGCHWWPWPMSAEKPDWGLARLWMSGHCDQYHRFFAPWPEPAGHPQHTRIGELAREIFGDRVTFYATYRYGGPRTTGTPVEPEPWMIPLKLRALACYESQILNGPRRFFMHALDEWTMP